MTEASVNYQLVDRDFAQYLEGITEPGLRVQQGLTWLNARMRVPADRVRVTSVILSSAKDAFQLPEPSPEIGYDEQDSYEFTVQMSETLHSTAERLAACLEWLRQNNAPYDEAFSVRNIAMINLRQLANPKTS